MGCLLSTRSCVDLRKLNPFVTDATWAELLDMLAVMLLRANRVVQTNTAIEGAETTKATIDKLHAKLKANASATVSLAKGLRAPARGDCC